MWSDEILIQHVKDVLVSRRQTMFSREPILYIIDSYGCHDKMFNEGLLMNYNNFVVIVPSNLNNILQVNVNVATVFYN
jgi:hypothetical protein